MLKVSWNTSVCLPILMRVSIVVAVVHNVLTLLRSVAVSEPVGLQASEAGHFYLNCYYKVTC